MNRAGGDVGLGITSDSFVDIATGVTQNIERLRAGEPLLKRSHLTEAGVMKLDMSNANPKVSLIRVAAGHAFGEIAQCLVDHGVRAAR